MERVGRERGRRIYVLKRDGSVYFHLFKRRVWSHADVPRLGTERVPAGLVLNR